VLRLISVIAAAGLLAAPSPLPAQAPNADRIMELARDRDDGDTFISQVTLRLIDRQGRAREREFFYLQKNDDGSKRSSLFFTSPRDARGVAFHIHNPAEQLAGEDAQWMYFPVSRQTRRISTSDKRGAFMGSNFSYADLDTVRVGDYRQTLLGEETIGGRPSWKIERIPANADVLARTGYERVLVWVDQQNHLLLRQDFFDSRGVLFKQNHSLEVETVDGIDSIMLSETVNFSNDTRSQMRFNRLRYNVELPERLFGEEALRRGLRPGDAALADEWQDANGAAR
jgi:hypothetical protein